MLPLRMPATMVYILLVGLVMAVGGCGSRVSDQTTAVTPASPTEATALALATQVMASVEAPIDMADFDQRLQAARALWDSHHITDYSLRVRYSQPTWNVQILTIAVESGVVTDSDQSCFPERDCILRDIDPAQFTIDKLLEVAENVAHLNLPASDMDITFNATYGYPNAIVYPDAFWNLESFQPIKP